LSREGRSRRKLIVTTNMSLDRVIDVAGGW